MRRKELILADDSETVAQQFANDASAYCAFIDLWCSTKVAEPYTKLLRLLSTLAKSGEAVALECRGVGKVEGVVPEDPDPGFTSRGIHRTVGPAVDKLLEFHKADEPAAGRALMFADDLAGIYDDLRVGLRLYEYAGREGIDEAVWQWRFLYEVHWGPHLFNALKTAHEIRYLLHAA